jgi:Holliday junction DNA helicase RuvA
MIAFLVGKVTEQLDDMIGLDVGGVGYGLWVPQEDWAHLAIGSEVKLYVYEHIREQNHDLFGFTSISTKKLFEQLLSVNGVGPKMALAVLSVGLVDEVRLAIAEGNVKFLQAASGVGKKVAERIVVDLKDKVGLDPNPKATTFLGVPAINRFDEALEALVSLGFSAQHATEALTGIDNKLSTEERVKLALKGKQL